MWRSQPLGCPLDEGSEQEVLHDGELGQHLGLVHLDHAAVNLHV